MKETKMKKLVITAATVLGLTSVAMGQQADQSSAAIPSPAKVSETNEGSAEAQNWWSLAKKRHRHKLGLGRILMQSEPIRTALTEKAKEAGHDFETRQGKVAFFKSIKEEKKAWAKGQGYDLSQRKSRRDFRVKIIADQKAEAEKLGYNLESLAGKEQFALYLINSDRVHELMIRIKKKGKKKGKKARHGHGGE